MHTNEDTATQNSMAAKAHKSHLWYNVGFVILGLAVLGVSIVASVPSLREQVRGHFLKPYREILAKARGDLTGQGLVVSVIKLKSQDGISVEVFERMGEGEEERPLARLKFDERRDGHFTIRGQATNLALMDLDNDGILELIVPVYDENLIPRLHVFRFDPTGRVFNRIGPETNLNL